MFFCKNDAFLTKRSARQGCTKPKTELVMHQNPYFHENQMKINENPKINPPSTITIPESAILLLRCLGDNFDTTKYHLSAVPQSAWYFRGGDPC